MKRTIKKTNRFDSVDIHLASPEDVLSWSFGEVKKPETINYRTQRSERDGLFCEKIFGPEHDFQCSCGKYKGVQYHGIICEKCGVEITRALSRRDRMGHIDLATPIAHHWYLKKVPSRIATILGLPSQQIQNVVYYSSFYIKSVDENERKRLTVEIKKEFEKKISDVAQEETKLMLSALYQDRVKDLKLVIENTIIDESTHERLSNFFPNLYDAEKGGSVIYELLKAIDLKKKEREILKILKDVPASQVEKYKKQLLLVRSFIQSGNRPEWMFLTRLPVIPPAIRPVVPLDGGRYASSDLNDLYRHIIIRNNRLKKFIETNTPKIFINTQRRLLQEAVDALFSQEKNVATQKNRDKDNQLKSINEYISGKTGYFRSNLLGKRVDFSGRSVIVVGSQLKFDEFGLPKKMALEIFRPFVIGEILGKELAFNVRGAQRLIDTEKPIIWEILEEVMKGKYMLLNRQPTLHRQGIQAFRPILVEGLAMELHPLVCEAYNADFDGDTMAVHLPLSDEAQAEAKNILVSKNNIIKPASGEINATPATRDIVLGCYWATQMRDNVKGVDRYFANVNEAITAYDFGAVHLHARIKILTSNRKRYGEHKGKIIETTVGRILFNNTLPRDYPFFNDLVNKESLRKIIQYILDKWGRETLVMHLDTIKDFGFKYSTISGVTFSWDNLITPKNKQEKIDSVREKTQKLTEMYMEGYITLSERKRKTIELWQRCKVELADEVAKRLSESSFIREIIDSGSRGSYSDLGDMTSMFGIVESSTGEQIEQPIISSLKEGLSSIEYFNASFGARKGLADTAIKTANAGFLSRKLFDVAQEINIEGKDCGTIRGYSLFRHSVSGADEPFSIRIKGRYTAEDIQGKNNKILVKKNKYITLEDSEAIEMDESILSIKVRSPTTCRYAKGICAKCYGDDKTLGKLIEIGEPVGTIAAQSVGEPGTQLTMRTFHKGGISSTGEDITRGLPRVTEIFERRIQKNPAVISRVKGVVSSIDDNIDGSHEIHITTENKKLKPSDLHYTVPSTRYINVKVGENVEKGQILTDGAANLQELLDYAGKNATQEYIFSEVNKVYALQGINIAPVHFEIIIRQMFSRMRITDPGDATYTEGEVIELSELTRTNDELEASGKRPIETEEMLSGITKVSVSRNNFLSAASFQNTKEVLIRAAVSGAKDTLDGVKENVIIGRLVPIGTGYENSKKYEMIKRVRDEVAKRIAEKEAEGV